MIDRRWALSGGHLEAWREIDDSKYATPHVGTRILSEMGAFRRPSRGVARNRRFKICHAPCQTKILSEMGALWRPSRGVARNQRFKICHAPCQTKIISEMGALWRPSRGVARNQRFKICHTTPIIPYKDRKIHAYFKKSTI